MPAVPEAATPEAPDSPGVRFFRMDEERVRRAEAAGLLASGEDASPRLSLDRYHRLAASGILAPGDRVELLEGRLVAKMTVHPPHRIATRCVRVALERILPPGWYADEQKPVALPAVDSEPEPDVQVTRGDTRDYRDRHPGPADVALLVEVADSSLIADQRLKKRLYGSERIPTFWIVNLVDRRVEVYTGPSGPAEAPGYAQRGDFGPGEAIPVVLDGREAGRVAVADLLP